MDIYLSIFQKPIYKLKKKEGNFLTTFHIIVQPNEVCLNYVSIFYSLIFSLSCYAYLQQVVAGNSCYLAGPDCLYLKATKSCCLAGPDFSSRKATKSCLADPA